MKSRMLQMVFVVLSVTGSSRAEQLTMPDLTRLAQRAKETVEVTLDQPMLQLASAFLSKDDPDETQVKNLVAKLKGVYVRSFEFTKPGEYAERDLEPLRLRLKQPGWSRIVGVKSIDGENTEVYVLRSGDQIGGLVVLVAEPKELTIVHIDGPISPEDLSHLSGRFGIPEIAQKHPENRKKEDE